MYMTLNDVVRRIAATLNRRERLTLMLRFAEGLSIAEIAVTLNESKREVQAAIIRMERIVRQAVEHDFRNRSQPLWSQRLSVCRAPLTPRRRGATQPTEPTRRGRRHLRLRRC